MSDDRPDRSPSESPENGPEDDGACARDSALRRLRFFRAAAEAISMRLLAGGSRCIKVRGTFPQQFVCAGTSDQIERLLREPDL